MPSGNPKTEMPWNPRFDWSKQSLPGYDFQQGFFQLKKQRQNWNVVKVSWLKVVYYKFQSPNYNKQSCYDWLTL